MSNSSWSHLSATALLQTLSGRSKQGPGAAILGDHHQVLRLFHAWLRNATFLACVAFFQLRLAIACSCQSLLEARGNAESGKCCWQPRVPSSCLPSQCCYICISCCKSCGYHLPQTAMSGYYSASLLAELIASRG